MRPHAAFSPDNGYRHDSGQRSRPKLMALAWVDEACHGAGSEPYLLVVSPAVDETPNIVQRIVTQLGLRAGVTSRVANAMVSLEADERASLAIGLKRIINIPATPEWATLARKRDHVVVLLGTEPAPAGLYADAYLERHSTGLRSCLVPVFRDGASTTVAGRQGAQ